jgi:hypothetical protein
MAKRLPLVCQHLERISRTALERYQRIIRDYLRHREGVYALYRRGKLYYVGLASDLRWRLKSHLRDRHAGSWDSFSVYLTIGDKHLKKLESLLLRVILPKPKGNAQRGGFVSSENLKRRFKRDVRDLQRHELESLLGMIDIKRRITANKKPKNELASYLNGNGGFPIRGEFKGRVFKARVRRDGSIRFNGSKFPSPSAAGAAAIKSSCNGWYFWKYERAPGDWVRLRKLRKS